MGGDWLKIVFFAPQVKFLRISPCKTLWKRMFFTVKSVRMHFKTPKISRLRRATLPTMFHFYSAYTSHIQICGQHSHFLHVHKTHFTNCSWCALRLDQFDLRAAIALFTHAQNYISKPYSWRSYGFTLIKSSGLFYYCAKRHFRWPAEEK